MTIEQLHEFAHDHGIVIKDFKMRELRAVALPGGWIAIDRRKFKNDTEYKCALAHEIGHCETDSFYNENTQEHDVDLKEHYANRYAAELLLPLSELLKAMHRGALFGHILARTHDVTREFADMVLELYDNELCTAARTWSAATIGR